MTYTVPPTVVTGDHWSARDMNLYVRDNFAAGIPDIFTTEGDIFVGSGDKVGTRLGIGSTGDHLEADTSEALGLAWRAMPLVLTYFAAQDVSASSSGMKMTSTSDLDPRSCWANEKFTAPVSAPYLVIADCANAISATAGPSTWEISARVNGVIKSVSHMTGYGGTDYTLGTGSFAVNDIIYLNAGDYLEIYYASLTSTSEMGMGGIMVIPMMG